MGGHQYFMDPPAHKAKKAWKKIGCTAALLLCLLGVVAGITMCLGQAEYKLLQSKYNMQQKTGSELLHAERVVSEAAHELALRSDCHETDGLGGHDAIAARLPGASGGVGTVTPIRPNGTAGSGGGETVYLSVPRSAMTGFHGSSSMGHAESFPVSTQTSFSTVWSVTTQSPSLGTAPSTSPDVTTHLTKTKTATVSVTLTRTNSSSTTCTPRTRTVSVYVTVSPLANETSTQFDTEISYTQTTYTDEASYTAVLPNATLSGQPSTATVVQTDMSYTEGMPDATVSGKPQTETAVDTQFSASKGLPDATVSGHVSTVTNVDASTYTSTSASVSIFTTITITDLWGPIETSQTVAETQTEETQTETLADTQTETQTETDTAMETQVPATLTETVQVASTVTIVTQTVVTRETVIVEETFTVGETTATETTTVMETAVETMTVETMTDAAETESTEMATTETESTEVTITETTTTQTTTVEASNTQTMETSQASETGDTTSVQTVVSIFTTLTISDLFPTPTPADEPGFSSVLGHDTDAPPSLTPYGDGPYTTSTITSFEPSFGLGTASPSLIIVSGASAKPQPKGWGVKSSGNLVCTVMLVAVLALVV